MRTCTRGSNVLDEGVAGAVHRGLVAGVADADPQNRPQPMMRKHG